MAQKTQYVVENYSNERDRPEWRRRCKSCGRWVIVHYKASNPVCDSCQKLPAGKKAELVPYTYWLVVSCPGEFGYSKGAAFSAAEMREMVGRPSLIPGMVLERDGKRYIVNNRYDLKERQ